MSRAFVKEDVDPPERRSRKRSVSGLPPGAVNYITARGAERLRAELKALRDSGAAPERVAAVQEILDSVEVVDRPAEAFLWSLYERYLFAGCPYSPVQKQIGKKPLTRV